MKKIKLYLDNKRNLEWDITATELAELFVDYDDRHKLTGNWPLERCIRTFITDPKDKGGLQSVFDEKDYDFIHEFCWRARWPQEKRT